MRHYHTSIRYGLRMAARAAALLIMCAGAARAAEPEGMVKEAESAVLLGSRPYDDPGASGGKAVGWMGSVRFDHAPAANCLRLRYAWKEPVMAFITVNDGPPRTVPMMGGKKISGTYIEHTIWIDIPANATVTIAGAFNFDSLTFVTAPSPAKIPPIEVPMPLPASAPRWDVSSDDTMATVAVYEGRPCLVSLKNSKQQWEWIRKVRPMPVPDTVVVEDRDTPVTWTYRDAARDEAAGTLTLRFTSEQPALELHSRWRARPGPGPIEHLPTLINRDTKKIVLSGTGLLAADLDLAADQPLKPVRMSAPSRVGWYGDKSEGLPLPYEILQVGSTHGLYLAYDFDFGMGVTNVETKDRRQALHRFAVSGGGIVPSDSHPNWGKTVAVITLDPGQELVGPGMHHLAYAGDEDDGANRFKRWFWKYEIPASLRDDPQEPPISICYLPARDGNPDYLIDKVKTENFASWGVGAFKTDLWHMKTGHAKSVELAQACHAQGLKLILYFGANWGGGGNVKAQWEKSHYDFARGDGAVYTPGDYHAARGFYRFLDDMIAVGKGKWRYENCSNGGNLRSLDMFRRMTWMTHSDGQGVGFYFSHINDWSYMLHPIQIKCDMLVGPGEGLLPDQPGEVSDFRAFLLGSILTGDPALWQPTFKERFKEICKLYNTRQRAILRGADVYHIQPKAPWLGIQYDNPTISKGSVLLWQNGGPASQTIKLKGLDRSRTYTLAFQDDSSQNAKLVGAQLMDDGVTVKFGVNKSEIIWIE
ncbi:hypothetical protein LBMAG53_25080 [Planctomycetota bacterium]|nr:hypothetical protein LBMAG53_25080 [Planctomycetota bacterium]